MLSQLVILLYLSLSVLTTTNITGNCGDLQTSCRDGSRCVLRHWICDGEPDCPDVSDEEDCDRCQPANFLCKDQSRCIPYNWVCDDNGDCSDGSDEACSGPSVTLLILSERGDLVIVNVTDERNTEIKINSSRVSAMTYDSLNKEIYWAGVWERTIFKMDLDGQNTTVMVNGCRSLGMEIDPSSRLLFYTDTKQHTLTRLDLNGGNTTDILNRTQFGTPRDITLDILNRRIYWSDDGGIYVADYNGMNTATITTDVSKPTGLALGVSGSVLYWLNLVVGYVMVRERHIMRTDLVTMQTEDFARYTNPVGDISILGGRLFVVGRDISYRYVTVSEHTSGYEYHPVLDYNNGQRYIKAIFMQE